MTVLFYLFGGLGVALGLVWLVAVFAAAPDSDVGVTGLEILAYMVAAVPALVAIGVGLMFLAIGGVLARLDRIARATAITAKAFKPAVEKARAKADA